MPARNSRSHSPHDEERPAGRPIWSGSISFGLLQIPVSMFGAEARNDISFHQLDKRDLSPIGYQRINKATGKAVQWDDIVKGYEYEKGQYVVMTDEDFKTAAVEATQTVDIQDFVDAEAIDPTYFETPYYLAPTKKSAKAYAILREALRRQKKAAVATFVLRAREHLCALFAKEDVILLEILRFASEVRTTENLPLPEAGSANLKMHPKELEMAEKLVEGMTSRWDPSKYHDTYREILLQKIEEKAKTGKMTAVQETKRPGQDVGNVVDLMSLLKQSVEHAQKNAPSGPKKPAAKRSRSAPRGRGGKKAA